MGRSRAARYQSVRFWATWYNRVSARRLRLPTKNEGQPITTNGHLDTSPQSPVPSLQSAVPNPRRVGPTISPRARRVANELGIDWAALTGSGRTGRIVERDIRALA